MCSQGAAVNAIVTPASFYSQSPALPCVSVPHTAAGLRLHELCFVELFSALPLWTWKGRVNAFTKQCLHSERQEGKGASSLPGTACAKRQMARGV